MKIHGNEDKASLANMLIEANKQLKHWIKPNVIFIDEVKN